MYLCRYKSMKMTVRGEGKDGLKMSGIREEKNSLGLEIVSHFQERKTIF